MSCTIIIIVNGKIAPPAVNVADAVSIGDKMLSVFRRSLPSVFHAKMSSEDHGVPETRCQSGRENCVRCRVSRPAHSDGRTTTTFPTGADLLLSILCAVPPSLVDEFGRLRRGNKADLMNRL